MSGVARENGRIEDFARRSFLNRQCFLSLLGCLSILCAAGSVQGDAYFPANSALAAGQALGDIASIV
jgi:hypothetical protein